MKKVTMFTKNDCPNCKRADMLLEHCPVELMIVRINIDENPQTKQLLIDKGIMTMPTFIINDQWIEGFHEGKITTALGL